MKTTDNEITFANLSDSSLQIPLLPPEDSVVPEIQESTHQVPFGENSIFDSQYKVPGFKRAVYLKINEMSNWDTGESRYISLRSLAKSLNVKSHAQVHEALKWLIDHGWLSVLDIRDDGTYRYQVIHYQEETPLDKDGRPRKCAMPLGKGSVSQLLSDGEIQWRVYLDWMTRKVYSCWETGYLALTVHEAYKLIPFTFKTLKENVEKMSEIGLIKRLSANFRASEYQLFPKPYPKRKKRKKEVGLRQLREKKGWIHSFNDLWKFNRETFDIMMKTFDGMWRYSNLEELYQINKHIHRDFSNLIQRLRSYATA